MIPRTRPRPPRTCATCRTSRAQGVYSKNCSTASIQSSSGKPREGGARVLRPPSALTSDSAAQFPTFTLGHHCVTMQLALIARTGDQS
jgi:hypothetical protein